MQTSIFQIRGNWESFVPHLEDADFIRVLNGVMTDYCSHNSNKKWILENGPWYYTPSDHWAVNVLESMQGDPAYREADQKLFRGMFGSDAANIDGERLEDLVQSDDYLDKSNQLFEEFYAKHSPQRGRYQWYQLVHGSYWVAQFTAVLVQKALKPDSCVVLESDSHSVVRFVIGDVTYYADLLLDWESISDLLVFLGDVKNVIDVGDLVDGVSKTSTATTEDPKNE